MTDWILNLMCFFLYVASYLMCMATAGMCMKSRERKKASLWLGVSLLCLTVALAYANSTVATLRHAGIL